MKELNPTTDEPCKDCENAKKVFLCAYKLKDINKIDLSKVAFVCTGCGIIWQFSIDEGKR